MWRYKCDDEYIVVLLSYRRNTVRQNPIKQNVVIFWLHDGCTTGPLLKLGRPEVVGSHFPVFHHCQFTFTLILRFGGNTLYPLILRFLIRHPPTLPLLTHRQQVVLYRGDFYRVVRVGIVNTPSPTLMFISGYVVYRFVNFPCLVRVFDNLYKVGG